MGRHTSKPERNSQPRGPSLDDVTFEKLRERIKEASGIYTAKDDNSRFVLERRLLPRVRVRGFTTFSAYEDAIDQKEMDAMLDLIAVHETYFFRESRQLNVFASEILPSLAAATSPVKIWSAGCSTGEEAYTIAMLMAERGGLKQERVEILASDLSLRVIESGIQAVYGSSSFRTTEPYFQQKYFSEKERGLWQASDLLRSRVRFEQSNLIRFDQSPGVSTTEGFDVIFCRNVLMYFDDASAKKTLDSLYSLLKEGGYLLLGHAESLLPLGSQFKTVQFGREIAHRK